MRNFSVARLTTPSIRDRLRRFAAAFAVAGLVVPAGMAEEADAAETNISTLALAEIPVAATVEIRLPVEDGSDELALSVTLADHFSTLLAERGYLVVDGDGELILRFIAEQPMLADRGGPSQAARSTAAPISGEIILVAHGGSPQLVQDDADSFRLRVSVARHRRPPLWTGYIERSARGAEGPATYIELADLIMRYWGQTYTGSGQD